MIRTLLLLFLILSGATALSAQTYNAQQEKLRREIGTYLTQKGFKPEMQNDGLKFQSDGDNYYIEIDKDEIDPMYLRLCRYVRYNNQITQQKVAENLNKFNKKFVVKVNCKEKAAVLSAELFVSKSQEFTDGFDDMLDLIKSAFDSMNEK